MKKHHIALSIDAFPNIEKYFLSSYYPVYSAVYIGELISFS